jgi:hypothetical protein
MVDHPIAEGRGADQAPFGIADDERGVGAGPVGPVFQLRLQGDQVVGQVILEGRGRLTAPLAREARRWVKRRFSQLQISRYMSPKTGHLPLACPLGPGPLWDALPGGQSAEG